MAEKKPSVLLLIDAHALIHRFFHALPPFKAPDGSPTNALYGIAGILLKIFKERDPEYIAAAFDRPEKTFREEKFEQYKAHRPPAAQELISQIITSRDVFGWFGIKTFELPSFEADDIIGTLAEKFKKEKNLQVVILSGDNDVLQLVEDNKVVAEMLKTGITETKTYASKEVIEKYGLGPERLADYKGLVGDQSDNIPGVKGIGPKGAATLLEEFGTVEEIFENLALVGSKTLAKKLEGQKEIAILSKHLSTIRRDAPVSVSAIEELKVPPLNKSLLKENFQKLGFKTLTERIDKTA